MPLAKFSNLDFDQIKEQIKSYLRANSNFTDFDFEGSNFSVLIDVLAYNTYINSYNTNMVANEGFIDSATLRENVVSLARNIGYVPRSRRAARASVNFTVDVSRASIVPLTITLQAGVVAISESFGGSNFVFSIPEPVTVPVVDGIATFVGLEIYEGTFITKTFEYDAEASDQRFVLPNSNIDTSTLRVVVKEYEQSNFGRKFNLVETIIDATEDSDLYLIQEIEDEKYELMFGDGIFGTALETGNIVEATYIITNGKQGNGVNNFSFAGRLRDNSDRVVTTGVNAITPNDRSLGGDDIESIDSVRKYAPRNYSDQNRCVTANDYAAVIPELFPETDSVSVYGGEDLDPPQYGKVFISIKPKNANYISNFLKSEIQRKLKNYSIAGIIPTITDLKYLYIESQVGIYYNASRSNGANSTKTNVLAALEKYADSTELNKFAGRFKYSRFLAALDQADPSITSSYALIRMRRNLRPVENAPADYEICFGNSIRVNSDAGYNVRSTAFKVSGVEGWCYLGDVPGQGAIDDDDQTETVGRMILFTLKSANEAQVVRDDMGTIDYEAGEIKINPLIITSTIVNEDQPIIEFDCIPESNDVIGKQDLYTLFDTESSEVEMIPDRISSGEDAAGSYFRPVSSYHDTDQIVRGAVLVTASSSDTYIGFVNGKPYYGPFHTMPDGRLMTGAKHSENAKVITKAKDAQPAPKVTNTPQQRVVQRDASVTLTSTVNRSDDNVSSSGDATTSSTTSSSSGSSSGSSGGGGGY